MGLPLFSLFVIALHGKQRLELRCHTFESLIFVHASSQALWNSNCSFPLILIASIALSIVQLRPILLQTRKNRHTHLLSAGLLQLRVWQNIGTQLHGFEAA